MTRDVGHKKMKHIIQFTITCLAVLLVSSCQSNKRLTLLEQHDLLKADLQLPRNLFNGGSFSFSAPPYYATYRTDHFIFMKYSDQGLLEEISLDDIEASRNIIVYVDVSENWIVLKDLFHDLNGRTFGQIHIAYDGDGDYEGGTARGGTFPIKSAKNIKSENIFDLVLFNNGTVLDLVSNNEYKSIDQLRMEVGYNIEMILIRGAAETTAGEIINLFDSLIINNRNRERTFLYIK